MTSVRVPLVAPWRLLSYEWLLRAVADALGDTSDELHCLWLVALDDGRVELRSRLEELFSLSVDHARRIAMLHSMWPVLLKLSGVVKYTKGQRLTAAQVDAIEEELTRLGIPSHPDRRQALLTAVGTNHKSGSNYAPLSPLCPSCGRGNHQFRCAGGFHRCTAPGPNEEPHFCRSISAFVMYAAAKQGRLESVAWLHYVACYDQEIALREAMYKGHTAVVEWILDHPHRNITIDHRYRDDEDLGVSAWRIVKYSQYYTMTKKWGFNSAVDEYIPESLATKHGDLDGLQRLAAHPLFGSKFRPYRAQTAAYYGQIPVLELFYDKDRRVFDERAALSCAVGQGHFDTAKWLITHRFGSVDDPQAIRSAVIWGRIELLEWMVSLSANPEAMVDAFKQHSVSWPKLPLLEWLVVEHGYRVTMDHATAAIPRKDTAAVQWILNHLRARGPLTTGSALLEAAIRSNNLELVQWMVDELQFWTPNAFPLASVCRSAEVLAFVHAAVLARPDDREPSSFSARPRPNPLAVNRRKGFHPNCIDVVTWLLDHGFRSGLLGMEAMDAVLGVERRFLAVQHEFGLFVASSPTTMQLFRALICHILDVYDPDYVRKVLWLPAWAARHGQVHALKRLAALGHANVLTRRTFDRLLRENSSEAVVKWMLEQKATLFTTLVVRWAVMHGNRGFLRWVLESFLQSHPEIESGTALLLRKCVRTALWTAARCGRYEMMQTVAQSTAAARDACAWNGISVPTELQSIVVDCQCKTAA